MKDLIPEDMTAWAIARDVNGGTRRALDVLEATQAVIAAREPEVQAFAFYDPRIARAQAEAGPIGPLAGVTVTVKDVIATRDMPTGHNNARYAGQGTGVDAACVDTLRSAGAVILSKSVTTEFAATDRGNRSGHPDRGQHDPARELLRRLGLETHMGRYQPRGAEALLSDLRHAWPLCP